MKTICLLFMAFLLASCASTEKNEAVALFDGKTLSDWEILPGGEWSVKDGVIRGTQKKSEKRFGMLISKKQYSDFEVSLKYKAMNGNSGFYFRTAKADQYVKGFQAEIDSWGNNIGGLYETFGRAWTVKVSPEKVATFYKKYDWNEMTVRAIGKDITVYVNGVKTAELVNDHSPTEGYFGFDLHGGMDMDVYFKDIKIKDLSL